MSEYEKMSLVELEMELDRVERCKFMINMADHLSKDDYASINRCDEKIREIKDLIEKKKEEM